MKPIYVISRVGRDFLIGREKRVLCKFQGKPAVRFENRIQPLHSETDLEKLIRRTATIFDGRKDKANPPRFLLQGREFTSRDQRLPFIKTWEKAYGLYA